jgi:hypothetical protein
MKNNIVNLPSTLQINSGDSGNFYMGYSLNNKYLFLYEEGVSSQLQGDEIKFKGNYGSMCYRIVNNYMETYSSHLQSSQFHNNFQKYLLQNANRKLKGTYNIPLLDHLVYFKIINGEEFELNDNDFSLNSISLDPENETTEIEIQVKETDI